MNQKRILVTGGAGYIGSHVALVLLSEGWNVVIADDLSTGQKRLIPKDAEFHLGNTGDVSFMKPLLEAVKPDAVMHFAASISVPESVENPIKYYENNFANSTRLIEACLSSGVTRFIFSSTAAVYGTPDELPVTENAPTKPINPYGRSKLMTEWMLRDTSASTDFNYVALRYFNVAGADAEGRSGQVVKNSTNLIKTVSELAAGARDSMTVFGDDYSTKDGTCIRDFIHVSDLADAHVAALEYLMDGGGSQILNCGYGHGYSVLDVIRTAEQLEGRSLAWSMGPRRPGDPSEVIADSSRLRKQLNWVPKRDDLALILSSAIRWERGLAKL